ncbi:MAG TPA: universal stress protein [Gaiellaceae bacterium]|jgi:nucleotide-binding universal stress UspA family protein|nr:universal stress protein [Gaiellaceae bacterium]
MKTILLGTDGSPASKHAAELAAALAKATGSRLAVVSGWSLPAPTLAFASANDVYELEEAERERARRAVDTAVKPAEDAGVATESQVVAADAVDAICDEAERVDADLVVVGSRGWSTARKLLLGSVSLAVLGHARRPVLVARGDAPLELEQPKILLATDGSVAADRAAALAIDLARRTGWPLHAVSVWTISPTPASAGGSGIFPALIDLARTHAEDVLRDVAEEAAAAGVTVHWRIAGGPPAAAICEEAADLHATLVVVGTRGWGAGKRFLFGSVSNRVVHEAGCPVLVERSVKPSRPSHDREAAAAAH